MKNIKLISFLIIGMLFALLNNCAEEKKDNNNLLLGLALLASQQQYEATVTIVGYLQQPNGTTIRDGRIAIKNIDGSEYLVAGQGDIQEFTKCQTSPAPNTVDPEKQDGQFTVTFKVNKESGSVQFSAVRHKDGTANNSASCSTIANFETKDYTTNVGTAKFTITVQNKEGTDQLVVSDENDLKVTIKSVTTVVKGTYNLKNPTVGENICDGKNFTGTPEVLEGTLSTKTISGAAQLKGTVTVPNGVTLTIQAGTVVFGNRGSSLFVLPGGKLITQGTKDKPVCFTSAQTPGSRFPGDWGGIVIVGKAKGTRSTQTEGTNPVTYGNGNDDNDNSGSLKYTIIEFAGNEVAPGDELNALSLYTVGSGTQIEYVQVHRGLDDGFEAWGGNLNMKYLVATGGLDDDYDLDEGFTGSIEYAIGHKYPASCGGSFSTDPHGFEMDGVHASPDNGCQTGPAQRCTNPSIKYFTMIGQNIAGGEAARLRDGFRGTISLSIFYNFGATNFIGGGNTANHPNNQYTIENTVYGQSEKTIDINPQSTNNMQLTLISLPIVSEGNVPSCGFEADKPDYTTNPASGAPDTVGASGNNAGKWWEGWTVYRAR